MTPSPTPTAIVDLTSGLTGIINALNGGTMTQVIAAVFILIVFGVAFFFKSEINKQAELAAKKQTEIDLEIARLAAIAQAKKQEDDAQMDQEQLKSGEKAALAKFLSSLDDVTLVTQARKAHGVLVVNAIAPAVPLTDGQRQELYKLYGV